MTHPALIERITRSLAYMLRHQPDEFGLTLDPQGFGEMEEVVRALSERFGEPVEAHDVEEAIRAGDRPRYEIKGTRIRALYGHSIEVEPGEPSKPPEFLYVGIPSRDAARAQRFGLSGGRRRFLHLALTQDDAREAGRRAAREYTVLRVFALDAWEEGVDFFDRKSLFLARTVPTEFLEVMESGRDGYEPRRNGREQEARGPAASQPRAYAPATPNEAPPREDAERAPPTDRGPQRERGPERRERDDRGHDRSRGEQRRPHDEARHAHGGRRDRGHDRRRGRGDRHGGERRDRPERPAYAPVASRAPSAPASQVAPPPAPARSGGGSDFGLGIFDEPAAPPPVIQPVRPAPPPPPRSAPAPAPPPDPSTDFGAGV